VAINKLCALFPASMFDHPKSL